MNELIALNAINFNLVLQIIFICFIYFRIRRNMNTVTTLTMRKERVRGKWKPEMEYMLQGGTHFLLTLQ